MFKLKDAESEAKKKARKKLRKRDLVKQFFSRKGRNRNIENEIEDQKLEAQRKKMKGM